MSEWTKFVIEIMKESMKLPVRKGLGKRTRSGTDV